MMSSCRFICLRIWSMRSFIPKQGEIAKGKCMILSKATAVKQWGCSSHGSIVTFTGKWLFFILGSLLEKITNCYSADLCESWTFQESPFSLVLMQLNGEAETLHSLHVFAFSFLRRWKLSRWAWGSCHIHCSDGWLPARESCPAPWSARPWILNVPGVFQVWHQVQGRL